MTLGKESIMIWGLFDKSKYQIILIEREIDYEATHASNSF